MDFSELCKKIGMAFLIQCMSIFNIPHDMVVRNRCLIVVRLIPVDLRDQTDCSQPPMIEGCGCHPKMVPDWPGRSDADILFDDHCIKEILMKLTLSPMSAMSWKDATQIVLKLMFYKTESNQSQFYCCHSKSLDSNSCCH